jgi:hypothetical protein
MKAAACSVFHSRKGATMTPLRQRMIEDMQVRNLALNTQRSYLEQGIAIFSPLQQVS